MVRRKRAVLLVASDGTLLEQFFHARAFMVNRAPLWWIEYQTVGEEKRHPLTAEALGKHTLRPMTLATLGLRFAR